MNHTRRGVGGRRLAIVLVGALGLASAGCAAWRFLGLGGGGSGELSLDRKRLVIAPFKMPGRSYFKSKFGARFSEMIAETVRGSCPGVQVYDAYDLPEELGQRVDEGLTWFELGKALKADYLLVGEIWDLTYKDEKSFGIFRGKMKVSARVFSTAEEGKVVWRTRPNILTVRYPPLFGGEAIPADVPDGETAVTRVMQKAAIQLAAPFIGSRAVKRLLEKRGFK